MSKNKTLSAAKSAKNDEFYTQYADIQKEISAYPSYTYDAFGNTIAQSGALADTFSFRFSTKYFDTETGFYYYGYRFYSPELMRWLNRDPIEEAGGENLYAMCGNSPVSMVDFLGKWAISIGVSLDFGASSGISLGLSIGIAYSRSEGFTIGIVRSGSIGFYVGVGASADVVVSLSPNAPSVSEFSGVTTMVGASGGEGIIFGGSVGIPLEVESGYATFNASIGIGAGTPVEGHMYISRTIVSKWCLTNGKRVSESTHSIDTRPIRHGD